MVDSKDCRDNAEQCVDLGNEAKTVEEQNLFFEMARNWTELAERLERIAALPRPLQDVGAPLN